MWENWRKCVYWRCYALHVAGLCLCLTILGYPRKSVAVRYSYALYLMLMFQEEGKVDC